MHRIALQQPAFTFAPTPRSWPRRLRRPGLARPAAPPSTPPRRLLRQAMRDLSLGLLLALAAVEALAALGGV